MPFVELTQGRQGGFVTVVGTKVYLGGGYTNQAPPGDGSSDQPYAEDIEVFDYAAATPTARIAYTSNITIFADAAAMIGDTFFVADHFGANLLRCTGDTGGAPGTCELEFDGSSPLTYRQDGQLFASDATLVSWGGQEPTAGTVFGADVYDPFARTTTKSANPRNRIFEAVVPLGPHQWLSVAGQSYEAVPGQNAYFSSPLVDLVTLDPVSSTVTFEARPSLSRARRSHTATRLLDGRILVVGGWHPETSDSGGQEDAWRESEIIHADGTVTVPAPLMASVQGRASHGAALLPNGQVLVGGGYISATTSELFKPTCPVDEAKEYWSKAADMPAGGVHYPRFVSVPFGVLSVGGELASNPVTSRAAQTVWLYCPTPIP